MNSNVESSTPGLWSGGLVIALLISIGLIGWVQLPFKPDRPPEPREGLGYTGIQDVDARLWQDPFAAVEAARKEARAASSRCWTIGERDRGMPVLEPSTCEEPSQTNDPAPRTCKQFIRGMEIRIDAGETVRILAVMVSGGPSSGAPEARRRQRYAILSGLMLEGFEPADAEHVGYFELGIQGLPGYVPYEWLKPGPQSETGKNLVLLWLDEDGFRSDPGSNSGTEFADLCGQSAPNGQEFPSDKQAKPPPPPPPPQLEDGLIPRIGQLLTKIRTCDRVRIDVMGPSDSTILERILAEAPRDPLYPDDIPFANLWSPNATIPIDVPCLDGWTPTSNTCFLVLQRTIADDTQLAELLIDELEKRRVQDAKNIALVGQLDTAYSRRLRDEVQKQWCDEKWKEKSESDEKGGQAKQTASEEAKAKWLKECGSKFVSFGYLRGLDGQTPGASAPTESASKSAAIERATGDAQIDYLRRMRNALLIKDGALRSACSIGDRFSRKCGIQAIGVLGNDYYDKLLVLQALKPAFPNAVFFTTDLEADMWHPEHNPYTRNLIVASGFGLTLSDACQQSVPPLRDGYQAASLLTTRLIVGDSGEKVSDCWDGRKAPPPRLFEIGRTQAIDLAGKARDGHSSATDSFTCLVENAHPDKERRRYYLGNYLDESAGSNVNNERWTTLRLVMAALLLTGLLVLAVVLRDRALSWVGVSAAPRNPDDVVCQDASGGPNESSRDSSGFGMALRCVTAMRLTAAVCAFFAVIWTVLVGPVEVGVAALVVGVILYRHVILRCYVNSDERNQSFLFLILGLAAFVGVAVLLMFHDILDGGEPFSLLEGVSVWPSEIIRVIAGLLATYFFVRAFYSQKEAMDKIQDMFKLPPIPKDQENCRQMASASDRAPKASSDHSARSTDPESDTTGRETTQESRRGKSDARENDGCAGVFGKSSGKPESATKIWWDFRSCSSLRATLGRIAPETILFFALSFVLMLAFGMPNRPTRSELSWLLDSWIMIGVLIPFLGLLFLMVDATKRTRKLAEQLSQPVSWPRETLEEMNLTRYLIPDRTAGRASAVQGEDVVWLDVKLIAAVTQSVGNLVWYPMWVLLLLIAARHPVFDAWSMPAAWIAVVGATAFYAGACAWVLRQSAERVREDAKRQLEKAIRMTLDTASKAHCRDHLQFLLDEVRGISDGAFRPFTEQPLVRAAFTAISSLSGLALLQYSSIFNL